MMMIFGAPSVEKCNHAFSKISNADSNGYVIALNDIVFNKTIIQPK